MVSRIDSLLKFLEQDPNDTFTLYAIALEYASQKFYDESVKYFRFVLKIDSDYLAAYQQLGHILAITQRKEEAIKTYKDGIEVAIKQNDKHIQANIQKLIDELS